MSRFTVASLMRSASAAAGAPQPALEVLDAIGCRRLKTSAHALEQLGAPAVDPKP
jgi:hypothetical protein